MLQGEPIAELIDRGFMKVDHVANVFRRHEKAPFPGWADSFRLLRDELEYRARHRTSLAWGLPTGRHVHAYPQISRVFPMVRLTEIIFHGILCGILGTVKI